MTNIQATKANSLIGSRQSPKSVLSPKQLELADYILEHQEKNWKSVINVPLEKAWQSNMNF